MVILNHTDNSKLETEQLFWDQNTDYLFSEKKFTLTSPDNVINGVGFESKKDLSKFLAKQTSGQIIKRKLTNEHSLEIFTIRLFSNWNHLFS